MKELKFVVFGEAVLYDYIDMILPNVWDELATVDSFREAGILTLAGEIDGETVGTAVARITGPDEVQVYSLYVAPDYRRMKVGTALLDMMAELAGRLLEQPETTETRVVETLDYTLEEEEFAAFGAFLHSVGFVRFDELPPLFLLPGEEACKLAAFPEDTHLFAELTGEARSAAEEFLDGLGLPVELTTAGYIGTLEKPLGAAFAFPSGDGDWSITSVGEGLDEDGYRRLLSRMFAAAADRNANKEFAILADGTRNPHPRVWAALSPRIRSYPRCIAHRIVVFEGE